MLAGLFWVVAINSGANSNVAMRVIRTNHADGYVIATDYQRFEWRLARYDSKLGEKLVPESKIGSENNCL